MGIWRQCLYITRKTVSGGGFCGWDKAHLLSESVHRRTSAHIQTSVKRLENHFSKQKGVPWSSYPLSEAEDFMTKNWSKEQQGIKDTIQGAGLGKKVE